MGATAYDVAVAGGGTAGVVAAIQAGRAGARVLLVEKTGKLGGTITNGGVNAVSCFNAYERQVIAGIGWELVCRTLTEAGEPLPDFSQHSPKTGCLLCPVNPTLFAAIADDAVLAAGVEPLFHAMPAAARPNGSGWTLTLCTKTGLRDVAARTVVDCTGDANVVSLAGLPVERNEELQPATLVFRLDGYDPATLDFPTIQAAFTRAVASGEVKATDAGWVHGDIRLLLRGRGGNCVHVVNVDGRTSEGRTEAELEGRRVLLRLFRFLRRQPGLQGLRLPHGSAEVGIRETVTIKGRRKILVDDYESGRQWDDAIAYSFYPVDIHTADGLVYRPLPRGVVPTIPFGALIPESGRNLLAAGRCIAGDKGANSAYRVQSTCMAVGQAAGAAAALAVRLGVDAADVPLAELRDLLRSHGAIVP
jgi:hypothetical protein